MRYIALEEAFAVPELVARQPATEMRIRVTDSYAAVCGRKLIDSRAAATAAAASAGPATG